MSELLLCGRVTEHDGDIVSVCLWSVAEFVPIGSPEHREMVAKRILPAEEVMSVSGRYDENGVYHPPSGQQSGSTERQSTSAERATFWRWLVWALAGFWMAVGLAFLWRKL